MTTTKTTTEAAPAGGVRMKKHREPERFALIGVWIAVIVFFSFASDRFMTEGNISSLLGSQAVLLILALGLLLPLRVGDFDLSVASTLGLSAMLVALLNVQHGWSVWLAALFAIAVGCLIGLVNGVIVVRWNINPFIVTLGMSTFIQGVIFWVSKSNTISGIDPALSDFVLQDTIFGIPADFWYALIVAAVIWYVFEFTPLGQRFLFVGQSQDMARLNGIAVSRTRVIALIASGGIAALAGVILAGSTGSADPNSAASFLMPAFAACFLGTTVLKIGRFNPWGTVIALYFIGTGTTGLQLLGAQNYVQQLFYGAALIIAVILAEVLRKRNARRLQNEARQAALAAKAGARSTTGSPSNEKDNA